MNENLQVFCFDAQAQVTAASVHCFYAIKGFTIIGVSLEAEAFTGTPTGFNIDVQDDGSDVITAVTASTALTPGTWLSTAVGGAQTPVKVAAGSEVEIDVNLTAGSAPTADYHLQLWVLMDD